MHVLTKRELEILAFVMDEEATIDHTHVLYGIEITKDLQEAHLRLSNLKFANFQNANLCEANLWRADAKHANFEGANLEWASLVGAYLLDAIGLDTANLQGAMLDYPVGMSSRNDRVVKRYGLDRWKMGCFKGNTAETIARLQEEKSGRALRSYLSNMLMMLCNDHLPAETEQLIADALMEAIQQCKGTNNE